ncbi:endonuclease VII domain-containing protein [Rhodococcus sp. NPDC019627]|uniref:endonuclease VII domain-containing protein n=1 Tax=unclassified Rhodococcus (in: high G+C Gram-positive bacteria) TaxID=192944 RepID=UPI0037AB8EE3
MTRRQGRPCVDCLAEIPVELEGTETGRKIAGRRPAPFPGPRCASHNRDAVKAAKDRAHDRRVCRLFGLQPGEYAEILEAQGGRCFICQTATGKAKRLAVDHDHACCPELPACGKCVRGLVCGWCNQHIVGRLRDDVDAARRLVFLLGPLRLGSVLIARRAARVALADQGGRLGPLAGEWPGVGVPIAHKRAETVVGDVRDTPADPITL